MLLLLRFPKMVEVDNARLIILYVILQVCAISLLSWWFISARFYDKSVDISSHIAGSLVVLRSSASASAAEARARELHGTWCNNIGDYDFWRDEAGYVRYGNLTCSMPCTPGQEDPSCVAAHDTVMQSSSREVFVPTLRTRCSVGQDGQQNVSSEVLLAADSITLGLSYFFDLPLYELNGAQEPRARLKGSSERDVVTELFRHDGQKVRTFTPGQPMSFPLQELLSLAGVEEQLDTPHLAAGRNRRPGSEGEFPKGRLSGLELELVVTCQGNIGYYSHGIEACHLAVQKTERGWVHQTLVNHFRSKDAVGIASVDYAGIRISMRGEGRAHHWDVGTFIEKLTSCIVILLLPRRLVMMLCVLLLGHLSTIYRHAVFEKFNLKTAIAGMSARLLVWNAAFVDLADHSSSDGSGIISKKRMNERLSAVMKSRNSELDGGEVSNLCEYTYQAMLHLSRDQAMGRVGTTIKDSIGEVGKEIGLSRARSLNLAGDVDCDNFSVACTDSESLNFDAVVKLFDVQRQRWFMERLFTPRALMDDIHNARPSNLEAEIERESSEGSLDTRGGRQTPRMGFVLTDTSDRRASEHSVTLEEEKELRKNVHIKVASLLRDGARLRKAQDEVSRTVEEHRRHFDARHRDHYARVLEETEAFQRRLDEVDGAMSERQRLLELQASGFAHRCDGFEGLLGTLRQRLAALEDSWHCSGATNLRPTRALEGQIEPKDLEEGQEDLDKSEGLSFRPARRPIERPPELQDRAAAAPEPAQPAAERPGGAAPALVGLAGSPRAPPPAEGSVSAALAAEKRRQRAAAKAAQAAQEQAGNSWKSAFLGTLTKPA